MLRLRGGLSVGGGRRPVVGYSERILLCLSLAWFALVTGRLLLPPLLPTIIGEFGLSLSSAGVMLASLQAGSAVVLYPSGRLSDRLGRATVIVPGLGIFVLGLVLIAGAPVSVALLLGAVTLGVGNGLFTISARALISDRFSRRRGRALGLFAAGFNLGGIVAAAIAAVTLVRWRLPFAAIAVLLTLVTLLFVYWNREPYAVGRVDLGLRASGRRLLAYRDLRGPIIAYSLFFVVTQSFLGFFPTYLQDVKGLSPVLASAGFALVFAIGAVSKVAAGVLSDRAPRRTVALGGIVLAGVGLGVLILAEGVVALALGTAVFAIGHQAQFPLIDAILMDAVTRASLGSDIGAARTIFRLIGSLGPAYVGVVAQRFSLTVAFVGLVVALSAMAVLFWNDTRRGRR